MSCVAEVTGCRDELVDIQQSCQDQKPPSENWSSITVTEDRSNQMIQMTAQMQQVMIGQQQMQQQQQQSPMEQSSLRHSSTGNSVKLSKLDIPSFSGERLKWAKRLDPFEAAVHLNTSLSEVKKLNYLMSKLSGEAKNSVSGIQLSNENYQVAVEFLKERYRDKQAVVTSHYTEMMNLKPAPKNPKGLRKMYNDVKKHLQSLQALKQDTDQDLFICMITSKLSKDVVIQLEIQKGARTPWTVRELRDRLNDYIVASERAELHLSATTFESADHDLPLMSSAKALVAGVQATGNGKERMRTHSKCRYCSENHSSDECEKYATIEERKQKIKGRCYICLNPTHQSRSCRQRVHCYYCKQWNRHHRSLCPQQFGTVQRENSSLAEKLPEEIVVNGLRQNKRILLDSGTQQNLYYGILS